MENHKLLFFDKCFS